MGPGHTFSFKRRSRGITRASRQLRHETLGLFFSSTPFRLELRRSSGDYDSFIRKLAALGPARVNEIREIAIIIHPLDLPRIGECRDPFPPCLTCGPTYDVLIKLWRTFGSQLKKLGVSPAQLSWPQLEASHIRHVPGKPEGFYRTQIAVLYEGLIKQVLEDEGLLSTTFPNVTEELRAILDPSIVVACERAVARELVKVREAFERFKEGSTERKQAK